MLPFQRVKPAGSENPLLRIKRLILRGQYRFTLKAELERLRDGLTETEVLESIIMAPIIKKTLTSRSRYRAFKGEKLYVIEGLTYDGILVYTKGAIRKVNGEEMLYILVSSKRSR